MKKLILLFLFISAFSFSQSSTCENAAAMCSGNQGPFPNNTGVVSPGSVGCLGSTPNPAWFYLQVGQSGNIDFILSQTTSGGSPLDVDFILWGPFNTPYNCNNLYGYTPGYTGPSNVVDCSYSASGTEDVNITNAVAGQFYMLLVTNFSGQVGSYSLIQNGGAGALSCEIVCGVDLGKDELFCSTTITDYTITATFNQAPTTAGTPTYSWFFNGVPFTTTTVNSLNVNQAGTWSVEVTRPGCSDLATDSIVIAFSVPPNVVPPPSPIPIGCGPYDLTSLIPAMVAPLSPADFVVYFYENVTDSWNGSSNFIADPANYSPTASIEIYIRIENLGNPVCNDVGNSVFLDYSCSTVSVPTITTTAPTCTVDGSSVILNYDAALIYTFTPVGPTVGAGGVISGMILGTDYTVTANDGTTTSGASVPFSNVAQLSIPVQSIITTTAATCAADGVSTITNYDGALTYVFTPAGPTVGVAGLISDMIVGTSYTVVADNGSCSSVDSAAFSNDLMLVTPAVPAITSVTPTCLADGTSTISNYDVANIYTFTPAGPTVGAGGLISGMTLGTDYTVTSANATCTSVASVLFNNGAQLSIPVQPIVATTTATCASDGISTITNYDGALTYVFTPAGPTVGVAGLISDITIGTSYTVVADNGSCSSVASATFSNELMLVTPAVPTIASVLPTCLADGTSTISNYDVANTYTFTPAGPTVGAGGLISGMTLGTDYTVTSANATCTSVASALFSNGTMLVTPVQPTVATTATSCASDGVSTITNYDGALTYVFTPAGPTVGVAGLISSMTAGTSYTVVADNGSCSSVASAAFSNDLMLVTPAIPTIASFLPTCLAEGTSTISNYDVANTYAFTPAGPTIGAGGLISGMTLGTDYTVTSANATCTSVASALFSNGTMLVTPVQPTVATTAATCASDGVSTITNYDGALTYVFTPAGPTVGVAGLISSMTAGTSYTVVADNGSCSSVDSATFSNDLMLVTPAVPTIASVLPTCLADGTSTISNYDVANTFAFTPAGPTIGAGGLISGMTLGTDYTVTSANATCTSVASALFSNGTMLVTPVQPTVATTAATCASDGVSTITNYDGALTYVFTPAGPTVGVAGLISDMTIGTSYTVVADNGSCSSVASLAFSNDFMLVTPAVPTIASVLPTCLADGTSTISNYDVANIYTFTPAGPTVGAGGLISGMALGTNYTVTSANATCTSVASALFSNGAGLIPVLPTFTQIQPICQGIAVVLPTRSNNGIVGTWSPLFNENASTTYTFTPATGECGTTTQMTVQVIARPEVIIASPSTSYCSGATTNITLTSTVPGTTFTWSAISSNLDSALIINGNGDTITQTLNLDNDLSGGFVTYTITPLANSCSGTPKVITIYVNPTPIMTADPALSDICSGNATLIDFSSNISGVTYTWTSTATGVTGASNAGGTKINDVLTSADATTGGFVIYTITPSLNGCIGLPVTVQVTVKPRPEFFGAIPTTEICTGDPLNINLSASIAGTVFEWTVFSSTNVTGANAGSGVAITDSLIASTVQGTVIYTVTPALNGCTGAAITVTVVVNPLPKPTLEDGTICVNETTGVAFQFYTLDTGLATTGYSFDWFLDGVLIPGANQPTYTANEVGIYSVVITNTTTTCKSEEVFATVDFVYPASSLTTIVTNAFSNNATIIATVVGGTGSLLYQLDQGELQESNIFEGVSSGPHTITVIDTQGCTFLTEDVLVIGFPNYFTPNGDGVNDTWNVIGLEDQDNAVVFIYDRYGKLLKKIRPADQLGWDGLYNGSKLPSTDYWFTVDYLENGSSKQFKAHFSLIR
ncbi:T9SS type B sorting domain-containing protein [Flavobacterium ardleyense]|uniref:T9SS type B sorting domain-containing protein n=1 Tax=Flavobacterium ardleyense TaxID=2038737 RepID=A0ABW5Z7C6_9FLAO